MNRSAADAEGRHHVGVGIASEERPEVARERQHCLLLGNIRHLHVHVELSVTWPHSLWHFCEVTLDPHESQAVLALLLVHCTPQCLLGGAEHAVSIVYVLRHDGGHRRDTDLPTKNVNTEK